MSSKVEIEDIRIVEFSTEYMDDYLDLAERNTIKDPQFPKLPPRDERKSRILRQISSGVIKAHFLALHEGSVVGLTRALTPPTCGNVRDRAILVLTISHEYRDLGIESELLKRVCEELHSKSIKWIEMGMMDSMSYWKNFLELNGFERFEESAGLILRPDVPVHELPPLAGVVIRPVQFPKDRNDIIELFRGERIEDAPRSCDIVTPWWEVEPWASILDPEGFLVAEEIETGEIVGFVDAWFYEEEGIRADIGENEVARRYLGTRLRERMLLQVIDWLRSKGDDGIRTRIHMGYRNEENLFQRLGFEVEYMVSNWHKQTQS